MEISRRNFNSKDFNDEVYLLCMMLESERRIFGIFTDEKLLIRANKALLTGDGRCLQNEKISQKPIIYKLPLNMIFYREAKLCSNNRILYDRVDEFKVTIEDVCQRIKVAEFYGFSVYCDLGFSNGAFYEVEYHSGDESYCGKINIEEGTIYGGFNKYLMLVLEEWYERYRDILIEIWQTRELIDITEWEED